MCGACPRLAAHRFYTANATSPSVTWEFCGFPTNGVETDGDGAIADGKSSLAAIKIARNQIRVAHELFIMGED